MGGKLFILSLLICIYNSVKNVSDNRKNADKIVILSENISSLTRKCIKNRASFDLKNTIERSAAYDHHIIDYLCSIVMKLEIYFKLLF